MQAFGKPYLNIKQLLGQFLASLNLPHYKVVLVSPWRQKPLKDYVEEGRK